MAISEKRQPGQDDDAEVDKDDHQRILDLRIGDLAPAEAGRQVGVLGRVAGQKKTPQQTEQDQQAKELEPAGRRSGPAADCHDDNHDQLGGGIHLIRRHARKTGRGLRRNRHERGMNENLPPLHAADQEETERDGQAGQHGGDRHGAHLQIADPAAPSLPPGSMIEGQRQRPGKTGQRCHPGQAPSSKVGKTSVGGRETAGGDGRHHVEKSLPWPAAEKNPEKQAGERQDEIDHQDTPRMRPGSADEVLFGRAGRQQALGGQPRADHQRQ